MMRWRMRSSSQPSGGEQAATAMPDAEGRGDRLARPAELGSKRLEENGESVDKQRCEADQTQVEDAMATRIPDNNAVLVHCGKPRRAEARIASPALLLANVAMPCQMPPLLPGASSDIFGDAVVVIQRL